MALGIFTGKPLSTSVSKAFGLAVATWIAMPVTAFANVIAPAANAVDADHLATGNSCLGNTAQLSPERAMIAASSDVKDLPSALESMRLSQGDFAPIDEAVRNGELSGLAIAPGEYGLSERDNASPASYAPNLSRQKVECTERQVALAAIVEPPAPGLELGTLAIPIDHTQFDERWERVRRPSAVQSMRAELGRAGVKSIMAEAEKLERVNQWVNHHISYVGDDSNYGQRDFWATVLPEACSTVMKGPPRG